MSTLADIISQVNSLTGYNVPTASGYVISSSVVLGSGSVNDLVNQINQLTGYSIPSTSVTYVSGANVSGQPIVIYAPTPVSGTISTDGIYPGAVIKADHVLRIINALNGVAANTIIISGSFVLPQIADGDFLFSVSGTIEGNNTVNTGSSGAVLTYVATNITKYSSAITPSTAIFSGSFLVATAPLPPTSKANFAFYVNGQLVDVNSVTSFDDNNDGTCTLVVNTVNLDYVLEYDDQVLAIGKFQ